MSVTGHIFDIKEFALNDGPGVRTTIFFKGCPLRCRWCHNPEGWIPDRQIMHRGDRDLPCGEEISSEELAGRILKQADVLSQMGGGVTFSGGEPLFQPAFLFDVSDRLAGVHQVIETCGHASGEIFRAMCDRMDAIYMDAKIADPVLHEEMTGVSNALILANLAYLCAQDTPFVIRVPLIPGVTDTEENIGAIAEILRGSAALQKVELLPYNKLAGAKYKQLGMDYAPAFDEERPVKIRTEIFSAVGIESEVR